jgi:hypothetical protein
MRDCVPGRRGANVACSARTSGRSAALRVIHGALSAPQRRMKAIGTRSFLCDYAVRRCSRPGACACGPVSRESRSDSRRDQPGTRRPGREREQIFEACETTEVVPESLGENLVVCREVEMMPCASRRAAERQRHRRSQGREGMASGCAALPHAPPFIDPSGYARHREGRYIARVSELR